MKILELFAGSRSVGKVAEERGHEVFSVDLKDFEGISLAKDIEDLIPSDIPFKPDMVWASPPCDTFSNLKNCWIGRCGYTEDTIQSDIDNMGLPILRNTE